jgi:MFS family permease
VAVAVLPSRAVLTPALLIGYAVTTVAHVISVGLGTLLPFHVVDLGGSRTQIGLVFSVMTVASMVVRPAIGGWIDRLGARPVILPAIGLLAVTSLALHLPRRPEDVIAVIVGAGLANAAINMTASVVTARASGDAHRGEALSVYYLGTSLALAVAPPAALWLRAAAGTTAAFVAMTALTAVLLGLAISWPAWATARVTAARRATWTLSRPAIGVSLALVLTTIGYSSIYAFLPLYAVQRGRGHLVVWFFTTYSVWLVVCRALLGKLSDTLGRQRVVLPAMALTALGYAILALPPTAVSLLAAALVLGSASAVLYPTLAALVLDRAPDTERGLALGTLSAAWDLGVVVGSALIGVVADRASFAAGFAVGGVAAALGTLAFYLVERTAVEHGRRARGLARA